MSRHNHSYSKKRRLAIIIVSGGLVIGIPLLFIAGPPSSWEVRRVRKALSLYFAEHQRYPKYLETLVEESLLKEGTFEQTQYIPGIGYGSYKIGQDGWFVRGIGGSPLSEMSREQMTIRLRIILKGYYSANGRYPKELHEIPHKATGSEWEEIMRRGLAYSVSEDFQSFTLEGDTFGQPSTWPSEMRLLSTEGKIQYLEINLNFFFKSNNRYPKNLQEMVSSGEMPAWLLRDLTEGEKIIYQVAEDGKTAHLNGERVVSSW